MFQLVRKVDADGILDKELASWLDEQFETNLAANSDEQKHITLGLLSEAAKIQEWGKGFKSHAPKSMEESLFYLCNSSTAYPHQNYVSRTSLSYTWPLFFEKFPLGQIWLPKISQRWWDAIWQGEKQIAEHTGYNQEHPEGFHPQEASGLQAENFPLTALNIQTVS